MSPALYVPNTSKKVKMVLNVRRLWTATSLAIVVGTKGFVYPPCSVTRVREVKRSSFCSSAAIERPPSSRLRLPRQARINVTPWGSSSLSIGESYCGSVLFSAQQSVDGGVMLPPAAEAEEYAPFLSESIRQHLDEEWLPQDCHKVIAEEVARLYLVAMQQGDTELTTFVLDVGAGLETFDMGDAFVGPWDVANLASDFLMQKMGAETSGCSTKVPDSSSTSDDTATAISSNNNNNNSNNDRVAAAAAHKTFRLTTEKVRHVQEEIASDFSRYRLLADFMDNDKWEEMNTIVAIYQGHTPEDASEGKAASGEGVRKVWARFFPGTSPPDLRTAEGVMEALEEDFPDDPDLLDGLEVIVETVYGGEAKKVEEGNPDKGIPANPAFMRRAMVCKWVYMMGFLHDDIKRAPDDPELLAQLISGRARLKHKKN